MSHRTRHSSDRDRERERDRERDRSHHSSHHRNDKYERRRHRDDSRDRERYHSKKSSKRDRSRDRSRSKYQKSRSPNHNSRHHNDDNTFRLEHKLKDYKELPESKSQHNLNDKLNIKHSATNIGSHPNDSSVHNTECNANDEKKHFTLKPHVSQYNNYNSDNFDIEAQPNTISIDDKQNSYEDPYENDAVLQREKERIQKETLLRLQKHLENEGKKYPPAKAQASHPIFANDGSFLEMFKSMQGNMQKQNYQQTLQQPEIIKPIATKSALASTSTSTSTLTSNPRLPPIKRRGVKILKTGIVRKQRVVEDNEEADAQTNDSWKAYLKEVKRYKNVTCSDDNMTRSLVK